MRWLGLDCGSVRACAAAGSVRQMPANAALKRPTSGWSGSWLTAGSPLGEGPLPLGRPGGGLGPGCQGGPRPQGGPAPQDVIHPPCALQSSPRLLGDVDAPLRCLWTAPGRQGRAQNSLQGCEWLVWVEESSKIWVETALQSTARLLATLLNAIRQWADARQVKWCPQGYRPHGHPLWHRACILHEQVAQYGVRLLKLW